MGEDRKKRWGIEVNRRKQREGLASVHEQGNADARTQARTLGLVSLIGNLFRNLPEFWAMVGSLEKEKDHRGNVDNMPGKWTNFSPTSAHLLWRTIHLPRIATWRHIWQSSHISSMTTHTQRARQRRHVSVLSLIVSVWLWPQLQRTHCIKQSLSTDCVNQWLNLYLLHDHQMQWNKLNIVKLMTPPVWLSQ